MNIKGRIHARKILLVYRYEQYFLETAGTKKILLEDIEKIQKLLKQEEWTQEVELAAVMTQDYYANVDEEIAYIVEQYFSKVSYASIDFAYINELAPLFFEYRDIVREKVDIHTVSFGYDEMDLMDRVLFVLGYVEFVKIGTPKEIVLNEMIELAKRYGDDTSPKLINGIGHKVLTELASSSAST